MRAGMQGCARIKFEPTGIKPIAEIAEITAGKTHWRRGKGNRDWKQGRQMTR
jgi:hypothetical protein